MLFSHCSFKKLLDFFTCAALRRTALDDLRKSKKIKACHGEIFQKISLHSSQPVAHKLIRFAHDFANRRSSFSKRSTEPQTPGHTKMGLLPFLRILANTVRNHKTHRKTFRNRMIRKRAYRQGGGGGQGVPEIAGLLEQRLHRG